MPGAGGRGSVPYRGTGSGTGVVSPIEGPIGSVGQGTGVVSPIEGPHGSVGQG